ncbi:MAG: hypothetical protein JWQ90_3826 [Hydrocarboniphaga sp.]|uniref:hypothetical protein n=1 Tax=Hydrocarboniphaga sp. TaxID=2033016 RepID=UPI002609E532|nr:hypothetical protein [Hydrocarboniphaga sp.]MDB5971376.1 hypothetical protein [Hydrocarboniphaga sp.]
MNQNIRVCASMGLIATMVMFTAIWPCWQMLPPLSPMLSPAEVAQHLRDHRSGILIGGVLITLSGSLFFMFLGGIYACTKRMEGPGAPLTNGAIMVTGFGFFPLFMLAAFLIEAVYRPELSDDTMRLLFDLAMWMLVFPAMPALLMYGAIGYATLTDRNATPIFPRWLGFTNLWVAVLSLGGAIIPFFKQGPFAWNGLIAFWIPAVLFGVWAALMTWAVWRAAEHPALQLPGRTSA